MREGEGVREHSASRTLGRLEDIALGMVDKSDVGSMPGAGE